MDGGPHCPYFPALDSHGTLVLLFSRCGMPLRDMREAQWDLVAAVLADALGEIEFDRIANLLDCDIGLIQQWVEKRGVGGRTT